MSKLAKIISQAAAFSLLLIAVSFFSQPKAFAAIPAGCPGGPAGPKAPNVKCPKQKKTAKTKAAPVKTSDICGGDESATKVSINIGCVGKGNSILDATFAIIRFMSTGVGLVLIGSLVYGGIQYSASRGDPQATAQAITRIRSVLSALLIFIFAYAILNYLIPGNILK